MNLGRFSLWTAGAIAACVLTAGAAWAQEPFPHGDLDQSLATDFQAMQILSSRLSKAEEVGKLVDILAARDVEGFNSWLDGLEIPVLDKCWWVQDRIDAALKTTGYAPVCRVRTNLTWAEIMLYFRILDEHRKAGTLPSIGPDGRVPDGPFLDDLKKHGLVDNCPRESVTTALFRPVLSKPYLVCGGPK